MARCRQLTLDEVFGYERVQKIKVEKPESNKRAMRFYSPLSVSETAAGVRVTIPRLSQKPKPIPMHHIFQYPVGNTPAGKVIDGNPLKVGQWFPGRRGIALCRSSIEVGADPNVAMHSRQAGKCDPCDQ